MIETGRIVHTLGLILSVCASALATGLPAEGPGISIRWELAADGRASSVSVVGLAPGALTWLSQVGERGALWPGLLSVTIAGPVADRPSMLGSYRVEGDTLRFTPRYPLDRGRTYRATFRLSKFPGLAGNKADLTADHREPKPARPATVVTRVAPSGDRLPENLLKFYLPLLEPDGPGRGL